MLIFGAYLAHRSGDNNTDKSRVAIYLTYNAAREGDKRDHYYDEKRRLFPPASDREEGKNYGELHIELLVLGNTLFLTSLHFKH